MRQCRDVSCLLRIGLVWCLLAWLVPVGQAVPVAIERVVCSRHVGNAEDLANVIDGNEAASRGWSVGVDHGRPEAAVMVLRTPVVADLLNLSMYFMSGRTNAFFNCFAVSVTSDAEPRLEGQWEPVRVLNYGATAGTLRPLAGDRFGSEEVPIFYTGTIVDNVYWLTCRTRGKVVTGIRIDVFPQQRSVVYPEHWRIQRDCLSWAHGGDFVLTEFRVELVSSTTNMALGKPVRASKPLARVLMSDEYPVAASAQMTAAALTDGWPSTFAHPASRVPERDFFFEIDLERVMELDHLNLRQRGDDMDLDRFGRMWVRLYEQDPATGAEPVWQTLHRPDGSFPEVGEVDVLRAGDGQGVFRGRYVRISGESDVEWSPMLAEVEVYERRYGVLEGVRADGRPLVCDSGWVIPHGVLQMEFAFAFPQLGRANHALLRWRLVGEGGEWQVLDGNRVILPRLPGGRHRLEVQAAHSDGRWDGAMLQVPFEVALPLVERPAFYLALGMVLLLVGGASVWGLSRRQIRRLRAQAVVTAERARISRDMHDDVGARLSQLAFMLKSLQRASGVVGDFRNRVEELGRYADDAMRSLDQVVWLVNPKNDRLVALVDHLHGVAVRYFQPIGIGCRVVTRSDWPDIAVAAAVRHELVMAYREVLQNVVKHASATAVEVRLDVAEGWLVVEVEDDGCGMPAGAVAVGRHGMENMRTRLVSLGGVCDVERGARGGVVVTLKLPLRGT